MNAETMKADAKYVVKIALGVLIALLIARQFD